MAYNLSQTASQFEVTWNSERKLIEVVPGHLIHKKMKMIQKAIIMDKSTLEQ